MRSFIGLLVMFILTGCKGVTPSNIKPVSDFELSRYLGTWYEIARIDHRFEKGLSQVSANYSLRDDGGVKVVNRGWNDKKQKWEEAVGKAYFVNSPKEGALKVSFFGPFYGGYNVIKLDKDYKVALVVGNDNDYLWILSRTKTISKKQLNEYMNEAKKVGFDLEKILVSNE